MAVKKTNLYNLAGEGTADRWAGLALGENTTLRTGLFTHDSGRGGVGPWGKGV